jgi:peptidoglycan/LPS O-acetylase OafA/YrhL
MNSAPKLHGLDHLRALAITLVFLFHYGRLFPHPEWTNTVSKFGWTGVDLFFVLSGYLIASQLFTGMARGEGVQVKQFYAKRFFRIIPAYLLVVGVYFLFPVVRERDALAPAWKYLSFTQNYGLDLRTQGTFSHAWSLCIEEQFYLLLPLLLMALQYFGVMKRGLWVLIGLFALGFVIRLASYGHFVAPFIENDDAWQIYWYKWIYYPSFCRLDGLLMGVGLAALFAYRPVYKERLAKYGNHLLVTSLGILTIAYFLCSEETSFTASVFGFPLVSMGYMFMVAGAVCPSSILYKRRSAVTAFIATSSYAIYLVHKFVIHLTQQMNFKGTLEQGSNIMFVLCLGTVVFAAVIMNRLVERPFLRLRRRWVRE